MSFRQEFGDFKGMIHLNNAGAAPLTLAARREIQRLADLQSEQGAAGVGQMYADLEKAKSSFARFLGTEARHFVLTANLATSISCAAWGLPFREGDIILTSDQEYPSNAYAWIAVAKAKHLHLEMVPSREDLSIDWDRFIAAIRPGVRAVALSWVQYKAGATAPLKAIGEACRRIGAWLIVDGIQGLGALPFDLRSSGVDILCGGTHKWLCGLAGVGFMAFREELYLKMTPVLQGTMTYGTSEIPVRVDREPLPSASRFEAGAPMLLGAIAGAASIEVLMQARIERIQKWNSDLRVLLAEGLQERGFQILGEPPRAADVSAIVAFHGPKIEALAESFQKHRVTSVLRPHGLRLSPHLMNTRDEIERVLSLAEA